MGINVGGLHIWWAGLDVIIAFTFARAFDEQFSHSGSHRFQSHPVQLLPMQRVYEARRSCESLLTDRTGKEESCPDCL